METASHRPARVLIVDDDPRLVFAMKEVLGDAGYETMVAGDGHAAIQRLATFSPDAIVLDLVMPHVTGRELLEWMKQSSLSIPVIVATVDDSADAAELGVDLLIRKPFTLDELLGAVDTAVNPGAR